MHPSAQVPGFGTARRLLLVLIMVFATVVTLGAGRAAPTALNPHLATASGCTGFWGPASECGTVYGGSQHVWAVRGNFAWDGSTYSRCGRQIVTANGAVMDWSPWMCVVTGTSKSYVFYWQSAGAPSGYWFSSGTRICVYFSPYPGLQVCESVY